MLRTKFVICFAILYCAAMAPRCWAHGGGGGGHGGGHSGGHGGHEHSGEHHAEHHHEEHHDEHHEHHTEHHDDHRFDHRHAFTHDWYGHHRGAWFYRHPYADFWAGAGLGTVGSWLGWEGYNNWNDSTYPITINNNSTTQNYDTTAQNDDQSQTLDVAGRQAGPLKWLPLGVFTLAQKGSDKNNQVIHFAVNRQGEIRGNSLDETTDKVQQVTGSVDKDTRSVTWHIGDNTGSVYVTPLKQLTGGSASVKLNLANGLTQEWNLVRREREAGQTVEAKEARSTDQKLE